MHGNAHTPYMNTILHNTPLRVTLNKILMKILYDYMKRERDR